MDSRDLDRHSWCGAFSFSQSDFHLPLSVLQLDPADRAVLRVAGQYNYGKLHFILYYVCFVSALS